MALEIKLKRGRDFSWKKAIIAIIIIIAAVAIYIFEPYINQTLFPKQWEKYLNEKKP